ncbi:MAG: DUF4189 domain-containing protein [Calothrix sp. MO_167.B12]|nr:DUF4189 domain-containing protein [Calothrix sp. MO_167.B12]
MGKWGWGETLGLLSIVIAIAAFAEPEVRCMIGLQSQLCSSNNSKSEEKPDNSSKTPTPVSPRPISTTPASPTPTATRHSKVGNKYAAIAYSLSTGASGYGRNYTTQTAAERRAVQECEKYSSGAGDCKSVVSARNSCAALATASDRAYGWARNTSTLLAQQNALRQCTARGPNCKLRHSICSS